MRVLGLVVALPVLLAGCGDEPPVIDGGRGQFASPSPTGCPKDARAVPLVSADLDGDGRPDQVDFEPPGASCPGGLTSSVAGLRSAPTIDWDATGAARDAAVVRVPGRTGDLVLLREQHPRGGFQAHLYGYADGHLAELTVRGEPVFPFVATDVLTAPVAARCVEGGSEVLQGRRHQPVGIAPAWDVFSTTYAIDGNTLRPGATTEVADNVLDQDFPKRYPDLVRYALFENCRVAG
jgi:hypothetical protein